MKPMVNEEVPIDDNEKLDLINDKYCGFHRTTDKIVGGRETSVNEYPWLVLLEYRSTDDEKVQTFKCGGSLISKRYVLTGNLNLCFYNAFTNNRFTTIQAAHCVANPAMQRSKL